MTAQASSDVNAGFDPVEKPKHYNIHPSGIECVEYSELLPGNLSHACVYVWRHAHKGHAEEDLEKALWFLRREIGRTPGEQRDAQQALGLHCGTSDNLTRVLDRLRHLHPFVKDKEFVATVVSHLLHYELADAVKLVQHHLARLRTEKGEP